MTPRWPHAAELRDVKIGSCLSIKPRAVLEADPVGPAFPMVQPAFFRLREPLYTTINRNDGHRHLARTGRQLQFVRVAYASSGGNSFICIVVHL